MALQRLCTFALTLTLLSGALSVPLNAWMGSMLDSIGNKTLSQITLPGTHDSGAYNLSADLVPGGESDELENLIEAAEKLGIPVQDIITPWGQSQDMTFYDQLNGGIRYIDLRCAWDNSSQIWRTWHFEFGLSIETLIKDVKKFLDEQSNEVVVIESGGFSGYPTTEQEEALRDLMLDVFGDYLFPRTMELDTTISDMIDMNKRLLVTFENDDIIADDTNFWFTETILNSYADSCDLDTMISYNDEKADEYANYTGDALFKMSWTLTPDAGCIIEGVLPRKPWGLIELADTANGDPFDSFTSSLLSQNMRPGNIFIIDHFESSSMVETAAQFNTLVSV